MKVALLLALLALPAAAADIRFSDVVVAETAAIGQKVTTTRATNEASVPRSVEVISAGVRYVAGTLNPGESATVTIFERVGEQPVILFSK